MGTQSSGTVSFFCLPCRQIVGCSAVPLFEVGYSPEPITVPQYCNCSCIMPLIKGLSLYTYIHILYTYICILCVHVHIYIYIRMTVVGFFAVAKLEVMMGYADNEHRTAGIHMRDLAPPGSCQKSGACNRSRLAVP